MIAPLKTQPQQLARNALTKFLRLTLITVLLIVLVLVAFTAWLFASESGARQATAALSRASGGMLQVEGVHGRLAGPIVIERVLITSPDQNVTLSNLQLDWQPWALLRARLHLTTLHAERMTITNKIQREKKPLRLPENIALPLALHIDQVQIDASEINWGPLNIVQLGSLAVQLDYDRLRYRLQVAKLAARSALGSGAQAGANTIAAQFSGSATLGVAKPYALRADFISGGTAIVQGQSVSIKGRIMAQGTLAELTTTLDMALDQAQLQGNATLRPFSDVPFVNAKIHAQAINLAALSPAGPNTLPHTDMDVDINADATGAGQFSLSNRAAGLYSQGALPLVAVQARFHHQSGQLLLDKIVAALGTARQLAGSVSGSGQFESGALKLALHLQAVDLQRLDQRFQSTKLAGQIDLRHVTGKQEFTVQLSEPFAKNRIALSAHASLADDRLAVDRAQLTLGKGSVQAAGYFNLSGPQTFSAEGQVSHFRLQDLGQLPQFTGLDLNGQFSLHGARQPKLVADLAFHISDSKLGRYPLQGEGQAQLQADRLHVPKLLLAVGVNRLQVQGELSQGAAQLTFALDAPDLAQLGAAYAGALQVHGSARGSFNAPLIDAAWEGKKIRAPNQLQLESTQGKAVWAVDRTQPFFIKSLMLDTAASGLKSAAQELQGLSAHVQFSPAAHAPLIVNVQAKGWTAAQIKADEISIQVKGTTAQHELNATMRETGQRWQLTAAGGLKVLEQGTGQGAGQVPRWQGRLNRLDAEGRVTGHLAGSAPLSISQRRIQLDQFQFNANSGSLVVEQFLRDQNGIATHGHVERLQLASLLRFASKQPALTTDLQLAGTWDVKLTDVVNGSIKLRRQSGDMIMQGSTAVPLGLRKLDVNAQASNGQLTLLFDADGQQLGHVELHAKASLGNGEQRYTIAPTAALSGTAKLDIPSLAWAGPMVSAALVTEGKLKSGLALSGSFSHPQLTGHIGGSGLRLFFTEQGLDLRQGTLDGEFQNNGLLVRQLNFRGGDGSLTISGPVNWTDGKTSAQLALQADRFALFNRVDRKLVLSGTSQIDLSDSKAKINGTFAVNSGFFDLGRDDAPQLSDDVIIVGRTEKSASPTIVDADVKISLGDGVTLKGRGLDARLVGQLHVSSSNKETLRAQGELTVANGTYRAYGRKLAIEKGELRFNGPIDNPALNILAMQRGQEVEAGVAVRGTVMAPRITLVSEPSVPDAEKLSWLVLGRGLSTAGNADMSALQTAAAALLTESSTGGVQAQIATALGLDDISIKSDQNNTQQRIVTLGKQLSSKLYVSYDQGFETASSVLHMRYTLSKRLSLEAEAGARSSISLFFNFLFD